MGDTKDKMTTKKNDVSVTMHEKKGKDESIMFYLKANRYSLEGSSPQEANRNLPEEKEV